MKKIAFLVPQNKKCGVKDYSKMLLRHIRAANKERFVIEEISFIKTNNPFYYIKLAKNLSRFDLIHVQHEFGLFGLFGLNFVPFVFACPKKLIVTFHEFHVHGMLTKFKERFVMAFCAPKIFVAIVLSKETEKNAGIFISKHNIINTDFGTEIKLGCSYEKKIKPVIVHPGFVRLNKNQLFTLRLAKILSDIDFIIAGGGEGNYFEEVCAKAQKIKNVKVTGFLNEKDYARFMKGAGLVILPYLSVSQSAAFYDALSFGKPVLASDIGFFKDMEKEGACLVESLNETAFANRIMELFSSEAKRKRCLSSASTFISSNSLTSVAARNVQIYNEAFLDV